jgi:hypothetical protein
MLPLEKTTLHRFPYSITTTILCPHYLSEIELLWSDLRNDTDNIYSEMVRELMGAVDESELIRKKMFSHINFIPKNGLSLLKVPLFCYSFFVKGLPISGQPQHYRICGVSDIHLWVSPGRSLRAEIGACEFWEKVH